MKASVRDSIRDAICTEILIVLETADEPMTASALHRASPTSADLDDTRPVIAALLQGANIERCTYQNSTRYCLPGRVPATKHAPKARRVQPVNDVLAALEAADAWLTIEQLEYGLDLTLEQIRGASRSERIGSRRRDGSQAHEYGLAHWPQPAPRPPRRTGMHDQIAAIITREPGLPQGDIATRAGVEKRNVSGYLRGMLANLQPRIGRVRQTGIWRYYPTGHDALSEAPATPEADTPPGRPAGGDLIGVTPPDAEATDAPARFGLWSDGTLSIQTDDGDVDLAPVDCHALLRYLVRTSDQAVAVFDDPAALS